MNNMIKAVIFDLDDTLLDRRTTFGTSCGGMADYLIKWKYLEPEQREDFIDYMQVKDKNGDCPRDTLFENAVQAWGMTCDADVLYDHYVANYPKYSVEEPGAVDLLTALKESGLMLGMITNGVSAIQRGKLKKLDMEKWFGDALIVTGEVGVHKPDKEVFLIECERLGVKPEECVFVGDNLVNDIAGAENAGMKAIWYSSFLPPRESRQPVRTLAEVKKIILGEV